MDVVVGRLSRGAGRVVRVEIVGVRGKRELVGSDVRFLDGDVVGRLVKDVIALRNREEEEDSGVVGERDVAVVGRWDVGELERLERVSR